MRKAYVLQRRDIQRDNLAGLYEIDGRRDSRSQWPQSGPVVRGQDHESQPAPGETLLIPDILIAGQQQIEPGLLRRVQ